MPPSNNNGTVTWKRKEGDGPVLSYRAPFSLDTIVALLNSTVFRPVALLLLPLAAYALQVRKGGVASPLQAGGYSNVGVGVARLGGATSGSLAELFTVEHISRVVRDLRFSTTGELAAPWLRRLFKFALFLNIHRVLTRYVKNNGHYGKRPADFSRDIVVITGGSAGIGRAIVELLSHKHHAKIAVLDMAPPAYAPAPAGAPEILYIKTDVTDKDAIASAAEQIRKTFGDDPAILINNAGIPDGLKILDAHPDNVTRLFKVNTLAHYTTIQQFLPKMIERAHGHIVSVASSASYMAIPQLSAYAVSKSGALAFHECLTGELRCRLGPNARKIRTSVVCPTKVRTALGDGLDDQRDQFIGPTLEPIQVAERVVQALEDGLSSHIIMPAAMNILPVVSRGPAWLRRLVELSGNTDWSVNDQGVARSKANGYGDDFEGEDKKMWERTMNAASKKSA